MPFTPSVTTFPSATAGELRGPENCAAMRGASPDSYLSCHISFPLPVSRQRMISLPLCREKTYSLSPTSAGVATPSPTGIDHFLVSSFGQSLGAATPAALPSRFGPRHCGQHWAPASAAPRRAMQPAATPAFHVEFIMIPPFESGQPAAEWNPGPGRGSCEN